LSAQGGSQRAERLGAARERDRFAANELLSKGGIGIISEHLYIVVNSARNELVLSAGHRWVGLDASRPEIVIFFEGTVWSPQGLPDRFDLSNAVVVSFEGDKVRFFDFRKMFGGYYRRAGQK